MKETSRVLVLGVISARMSRISKREVRLIHLLRLLEGFERSFPRGNRDNLVNINIITSSLYI